MFDENSEENIHLMIDLHNDVNDDALRLIAIYYLKEVGVKKTLKKNLSLNADQMSFTGYWRRTG